ncbi:hypothetical protein F52700_683 [Fusarium sp. NRRL 52700]|nr:hypothetical protein F52700_683 [Fusarium sp. NRRL 52700]
MPGKAIIIVKKDPSRDKREQRRWNSERDLNCARENLHDLRKKISKVEKEIDRLSEAKETLEEYNEKFKGVIQQEEGRASRKAVKSGTRRLQESQNTCSDQGLKLNKLKNERYELEEIERDWETWRAYVEEECHRRAVFEARIRNEEPQSYESWKKGGYRSVT